MDKNTTCPALLQSLFELLDAHRAAFKQERVFNRAYGLVLAELFMFARHTVTQGLLALGLTDADWSGWYRLFSRRRFQEEAAVGCLFKETLQHVPANEPYVVGTDGVQVPRSSHKMPGTSWLKAPRTAPFKPGIHRAQRFVHGAWLLPIQQGFSRAIPLRWLPAFPEKAVPAEAPACKEWAAGIAFIQWVREQLDLAGRKDQLLLALADGTYDTIDYWRNLPERTVAAVRTAKNRCLRKLPEPRKGRGKPRKYGEHAPAPADWLQVKSDWQTCPVDVRGRRLKLTYRIEGPYLRERLPDRPLFLIVVRGNTWMAGKKELKHKRREPSFYLVSASKTADTWTLPLPAESLLAWLWQRWELEVAHRELKSGLGLGEKQCWTKRSAVTSVQWSAWVYALFVLAGFRTWGFFKGPATPARWWPGTQRWSMNTLWRTYRAELWGTPDFSPAWSSSTNNWPKKEQNLAALWNSVNAAARN